ncbi:unnamed protein product [Chrysodeixis includens]|uniref:Retroviral polymerase SH3-like domain-containing protein n=1 Tax=Chrysodeixis includens TaxID=689277 RepID=A0A9N8Q1H1_CHRIL|nr:unnamed protein product [Chrysodeixis includens]
MDCPERIDRTLIEKARCMISNANLQKPVWAEAVATAAYIINRSPPSLTIPLRMKCGQVINQENFVSPYENIWFETMVHVPKERRQKWDKKSEKMILLVIERTKGYRVMHPKTHLIMKRVEDVIFFEKPGVCDEFLISARSTEEDKLGIVRGQS